MTAEERKQQTEDLLTNLRIPTFPDLPALEEESEVKLRTAQEIAARIIILSYLNCAAKDQRLGPVIINFLTEQHLWESVSDEEKDLFEKTEPYDDENITVISWRVEAIWLLMWVINKVDLLELPVEEADPDNIIKHIPSFLESTEDFIWSATIRPKSEIMDQADLIFRINWAIQETAPEDLIDAELNPSVAYERYFAINWVTNMREEWDNV